MAYAVLCLKALPFPALAVCAILQKTGWSASQKSRSSIILVMLHLIFARISLRILTNIRYVMNDQYKTHKGILFSLHIGYFLIVVVMQ